MQPLLIHWISCRMFPTLQERKCWKWDYHKRNPGKPLNWTDEYHKRQKWHLAREHMAAKAKKKQREERMCLKRMAVAAVRRRVRLEIGDEAEEVHIEGEEMEGEGKGPFREGQG